MLTSIVTVSVSGTLDEKLSAIAEAGFGGVEIFESDLLGYDGTARDVGGRVRELGLVCTCYQPFRDFEGLPAALRSQALNRAEAKFDVMEALGANLMLVCSSVHGEASEDIPRIIEDFGLLGERAARRGLRIGYEALAWGRHIYDHRQAWDIVRQVDHPAVGLILDSFHSLARGIPISSLAAITPEKIFLLQIADAPQMPMDYLYWSRHFRCLPSQGDFPVANYVAAAAAAGYTGPLSLEIFNDRFREWSAKRVANDGWRSLTLLKEQAGLAAPLPPRVRIQGIDFVEFAVDAAESAKLESMFRKLGFARAAAHRTKDVSLWRQGDINFVINRDASGWAKAHWDTHGASICAIALRVDNAEDALARAAALNFETFRQRVAAGELEIPWIRGVGGALTYFTECGGGGRHWTHDFNSTASDPEDLQPHPDTAPLGLTQIDHLSQTTRVEEFLSWQLYYLALFELHKRPPVELSDTRGLVQSQAFESIGGEFRVTLNGTHANQTLAARFVEGGMGAGVQHIALQCEDILSAARQASANELPVLPVPPNYYADLRARLGLEEDEVATLQRADLFFDRDAGGDYRQFYSRAFERRFFFEIVQRRGYIGYGSINAGIRLAAQARYKQSRVD
jgi:4-hydroxyphenylpyruvate dioxygenase